VVKVQRVENLALWEQFCTTKVSMDRHAASLPDVVLGAEKRPRGSNEKRLFHGTSSHASQNIICKGFDRGFARNHLYGKGVYFALTAKYSTLSRYSSPDAVTGHKLIFLARVLVGDFCLGRQADRMPSQPRPGGGPADLCDSTVDCEDNPSVFVTYRDGQCYPEYLITFREEGPGPGSP